MNEKQGKKTNWVVSFILAVIPFVGAVNLAILGKKRQRRFGLILSVISIIAIILLAILIVLSALKSQSILSGAFGNWLFNSRQNALRRCIILFAWLLPIAGTSAHYIDARRERKNESGANG